MKKKVYRRRPDVTQIRYGNWSEFYLKLSHEQGIVWWQHCNKFYEKISYKEIRSKYGKIGWDVDDYTDETVFYFKDLESMLQFQMTFLT
jgi:hypothetical protein